MNAADFKTAARELENVPLALDPWKAQTLVAGAWAGGIPRPVASSGSAAVVPIFGLISPRETFATRIFGGVSLEHLRRTIQSLASSPSVGTIVLQFDSPGGSMAGVEETFRVIMEARKSKRIIAVADSMAASAAYYLASSAHEVVVSPSGEVGSIGVYTIHFDWSENLQKAGIRATIVKAGQHKAEGTPYQPLGEDAEKHIQTIVDDYYSQFIGAVAKGRAVSQKFVVEHFGQGRTLTADRAVKAGLADRVATLDQVLADVRTGKTSTPSASASTSPPPTRAYSWAAIQAMATEGDLLAIRRVAFHEAGHAVMFDEEGAGVHGVFIHAEVEGSRIVGLSGSCLAQYASRLTPECHAGGLAGERVAGCFRDDSSVPGANSDFDRIKDAQDGHGYGVDLGRALATAEFVVSRRQDQLHAIAAALLERGQLSGPEATRILQGEDPGNEPPNPTSLAFGLWNQFGKAAA